MKYRTRRKFLKQVAAATAVPFSTPLFSKKDITTPLPWQSEHIKIGFNLLAWSAHVSEGLFPMVKRLKEIGYDGIEIAMASQDIAAYKKIGRYARELGLETNCVLAVGPDENPASASALVRGKALDRIKWAIDRAHDVNARVICGPFHSAFAHFTRNPPTKEEFAWSKDVLQKAGGYAQQADILLALEALNRFECYLCNTMEQIVELVNAVNHPHVRAMFDTHHANMEEKNYHSAIDLCNSMLVHVHISENDRGTPGSGHVPWDDTFAALARNEYQGWLTIESFTRNDPEFANAINVWRTFDEPWDVAEKGIQFIRKMCEKHQLG